jgi:hypothetical protein
MVAGMSRNAADSLAFQLFAAHKKATPSGAVCSVAERRAAPFEPSRAAFAHA